MSLISVFDLSYQAGSKPLFADLSFHINDFDRIGLVGSNGCGKSTLLKLLINGCEPDSGHIAIQRGLSIGLVEQFFPECEESMTVLEAVAAALPEQTREVDMYHAESLLDQLGLWDLRSNQLNEISGGQKNLVLFSRAAVKRPQLLLLDEPGNHMDSRAMFFLKHYLNRKQVPAFLMISHDRDLLDTVTNRTIWLRDERAYSFNLPYSQSHDELSHRDDAALKARNSEEKKIVKLQESADRIALWGKTYNNEKFARKAKSMQKRIDKIEERKTFVSKGSGLFIQVDTELLKAKQVFVFENETIYSPDQRELFTIANLSFRPGDRIALLGANGSGKSSCIESLMCSYRMETGEQTATRFNPNVRIGYFDQELTQVSATSGLLDWALDHCSANEEVIKRALIHWGFPFSDQSKSINLLSGGERARLLLMTFQLEQPNLLIMDEPTNHIDLQGKEELENDLMQSNISLLFTSHDQRFIENVATRFWWIHNGNLLEIYDPDQYFSDMGTSDPGSKVIDHSFGRTTNKGFTDEDVALERICELEELISKDQARKPKFQKLERQQQWQVELNDLLDQFG